MDVRTEMLYGVVSAAVSAGDGITYKTVVPQPSAPLMTMAEMIRRMVTHLTSPSATLASGGSAGAVAITVTGLPSGINGRLQGVPFSLSYTGHLSAQPTSLVSTASTTIRKVLVTITMSALPVASSFAIGGGAVGFVYGSAYTTSAGVVTSGGQSAYFDLVPLPLPSANEVPVGWLNIPNSFAVSASLANSHMICDLRAVQGVNMSALLAGIPQP